MKKLLKKSLLTFLSLLLIMSLVSCNNKKVEEEVKEEETKEVVKQEVAEETKQEEVKEETIIEEPKEEKKQQDVTKMSFWVVFYDQNGNELQREALKYGTVPEYKSWFPEGFDNWVYKKSGKEVSEFKPITGNTYFQAVCHEVQHWPSSGPTTTYTTIWEGNVDLGQWASPAVNALSWGGYDWSTTVPGTMLRAEFIITNSDCEIRFGNGSWTALPGTKEFAGADEDGNISMSEGTTYYEFVLTQAMIENMTNNGGLVVCGANAIVTAIKLGTKS